MQPSASKTILPIFNKKKRPRQAIFTYPNNGTNANLGSESHTSFQPARPSVQQPGYMEPCQPERNQQSYSQNFQNRTNAIPNKPFKGSSTPSQQPGFLGQTSHTRGQTSGRGQQMTSNNSTLLMQPQRQQPQQNSRQPSYQPRYNKTQYGAGGSSHGNNQQQHRPTTQQGSQHGQGRPNVSHKYAPTKSQYASSIAPNQSGSLSRQYASSSAPNQTGSVSHQYASASAPNQTGSLSHQYASASASNQTGSLRGQYGSQSTVPSNKRPFNPNNNNTPAVLLPFQMAGTNGKDDAAPPPLTVALDKSVKMITSSIEGMKHWSQYTDTVGILVFEMFGILNSAISNDESGTAKLFSLKEGQHSQRCIFYETDRDLQRLTRGQRIRCIGSLDKKTGVFRVVTARPASQQEQAIYKAIIAKCDQGMNEKLAEMQEQ